MPRFTKFQKQEPNLLKNPKTAFECEKASSSSHSDDLEIPAITPLQIRDPLASIARKVAALAALVEERENAYFQEISPIQEKKREALLQFIRQLDSSPGDIQMSGEDVQSCLGIWENCPCDWGSESDGSVREFLPKATYEEASRWARDVYSGMQ